MLYLKKKTLVKDNELYASIHLHFSTIYTLKCMCIYIMYDYLKRVLKIRVKNVSIFILSDYKLLKVSRKCFYYSMYQFMTLKHYM